MYTDAVPPRKSAGAFLQSCVLSRAFAEETDHDNCITEEIDEQLLRMFKFFGRLFSSKILYSYKNRGNIHCFGPNLFTGTANEKNIKKRQKKFLTKERLRNIMDELPAAESNR